MGDKRTTRAERVSLRADIDPPQRRTSLARQHPDFSPEGCRVDLPVRVVTDDTV
jgi:hypothetical protein